MESSIRCSSFMLHLNLGNTRVRKDAAYSLSRFLPASARGRNLRHVNRLLRASSAGDSVSENGRKKQKRGRNAFQEAITQLEGMLKEPAEVLDGMGERLSAEDLQLVLTYFAEEGKDSWFALEVFEWMQKANRVEDDTHQLMMSIMVNWAMKLVEQGQPVEQVKALLEDMHCVGLKPESRIMHSIISAYWGKGKKVEALTFVKQVMSSKLYQERTDDPLEYLIMKMVSSKESRQALGLVAELHRNGLKMKGTTYNAAVLAAVDEQEKLTSALHKLKKYQKQGLIRMEGDEEAVSTYEESLHQQAEEIARWAAEEESSQAVMPSVYERLLAMYCLAGKGLDAERNLWKLKLEGRSPAPAMFNTILGICAFKNQPEDTYRILRKMESSGKEATKVTFSVMIGGFIKGGNPVEAASVMHKMLERGLHPDVPEMLVVLNSLRKAGEITSYLRLAKALSDEELMEPRVLFFYIEALKLCIIRML